MTNAATAQHERRNDNIGMVFGGIFLATGVLTLVSRIFGVGTNPLWILGLGLVLVGYLGIRRAVAGIGND